MRPHHSIVGLLVLATLGARAGVWWHDGHRMVGDAAAAALPQETPRFFRAAAAELTYLNAEPDRWRDETETSHDPALTAHTLDHRIALERLPAGALAAPDRWVFLDSCARAGVAAQDAGLLPFAILEMTQQLRVNFRLWRAASGRRRTYIERRIIQDAGILGHFVADGSQPNHTSIHYDGRVGAGVPPAAVPGIHLRFEDAYVHANVRVEEVRAALTREPRVLRSLRAEIVAYLGSTHALVDSLYALDGRQPFGPAIASPAHHAFAVSRLAAGATMLRDLWWTAWVTSADSLP